MANAYPVVRTGWLSLPSHLSSISKENDNLDLKTKAFRFFGQFLALKIAMPFAFAEGIRWPISFTTLGILLVVAATGLARLHRVALCIILGLSFYESWQSWPFTINHCGLEFGILLLMCLMPDDHQKSSGISCADMVKILMLSVWVYSGIHKLFDGYYWNAEFFALEALSNETTLGHHLNQILSLFGAFSGSNGQLLACCRSDVFSFSGWHIGILLALSWLTIIVEIFLPFSLLVPRFRSLGIAGLFIFQAFIAYFSGEIDFAFTAFAILFLFIPKLARFTYPSLACLFLVAQPWI